jgi:hypothetical protein
MNNKSNNRIFGMSKTEFTIVVVMGGFLLCVITLFGGYIIYDLNRSSSVAALPPTFAPPTIQPLPINTPILVQPPNATNTSQPTNTVTPPKPCPPCTILVNSWRFEVQEIHSDPGKDSSRKNIILIGNMYNEGTTKDLFLPTFLLVLKDSAGHIYQDDLNATFAAEEKYGTELFGGGGSNPGAFTYVAYGFDVPASEKVFEIAPGELVASWGENFQFRVP